MFTGYTAAAKKSVYALLRLAEKPAVNLFKPAINQKNYGLGVCMKGTNKIQIRSKNKEAMWSKFYGSILFELNLKQLIKMIITSLNKQFRSLL